MGKNAAWALVLAAVVAIALWAVQGERISAEEPAAAAGGGASAMKEKIVRSEEEWKRLLTPEQYRVLREKGTEPPFSGRYEGFKERGVYRCAACGALLFPSETKFDSGSGWPSFFAPAEGGMIATQSDRYWGMRRTEVLCGRCGSHLGHVFRDGPQPTGLRYCINSVALEFERTE